MFGGWLQAHTGPAVPEEFYFGRPEVEASLASAMAGGGHVLLFGSTRQGKTTLLHRILRGRDFVTFYATEDTSFADICRSYLLTLGASVTVERKRKKTLGAKDEVSWNWPLISAGGGLEGSAESEVTQRSVTADIANPNDVCYLLREFRHTPCLVIKHFERLRRKQRRVLIEFLRILAEAEVLQVVMIASTPDPPLDYRERLVLGRCITSVEVPMLSRSQCDAFVASCLAALGAHPTPEVGALLFDVFEGSLEPTRIGCSLAVGQLAAGADPSKLRQTLQAAIHDQTQTQLLALVSAVVEAEWVISGVRRLVRGDDAASWERGNDLPIHPALEGDPVFRSLHDELTKPAPASVPASVVSLRDAAAKLGAAILAEPTEAERVRLLAFAIGALLEDPMKPVDENYRPIFATEKLGFNGGLLLVELLLAADPDDTLAVTEETIADYGAQRGWEMEPGEYRRLARRLRKLQRRLGIQPAVFSVDADNTQIVLWQPRHAMIFGDIRPKLREILDNLADEED